jgi:hypothetical protein
LGRVTGSLRRRYGKIVCPGAGLDVLGPAIDRLDPHPLHQPGDVEAPDIVSLADQKSLKHPAARERIIEMQFVNPAHQRQIVGRDRPGQVIHAAPADPENLRLSAHRQVIVPVDHRFALGKSPALPSAPDKKSRSSVNSPILACSVFTSIAGGLESGFVSAPKTPAALSRSCDLQVVIWFGCTSNCSASSASVFSPLIAAKATFALKAGLWFRRSLFVMLSPVHGSLRRVQAEFPLIQVVQISRASY